MALIRAVQTDTISCFELPLPPQKVIYYLLLIYYYIQHNILPYHESKDS